MFRRLLMFTRESESFYGGITLAFSLQFRFTIFEVVSFVSCSEHSASYKLNWTVKSIWFEGGISKSGDVKSKVKHCL